MTTTPKQRETAKETPVDTERTPIKPRLSLPNSGRAYPRCSKGSQRPYRLPGAVIEQYREKGGKRHGPYFFRVWWEDGRQRKAYVRRSDVEAVRLACDGWKDRRRLTNAKRRKLDARDDLRDAAAARAAEWERRRQEERAAERAALSSALARALDTVDRLYAGKVGRGSSCSTFAGGTGGGS